MNEPIKKTVYEWEIDLGIHIVDYDGFRDMQKSDKITLEDFSERVKRATVCGKFSH